MYSYNDAGNEGRTSKHGCEGAFRKAQTPAGLDAFPVPEDEGNPSQQVALRHGRIGGRHCIPASQNFRVLAFGYDAPVHDTVNKEAPVAAEQDDVSR
jgi:hypothetical protein